MIRHYLTLAYRTIKRNRFYFFINVLGLSLGLAGSIMIFSYVRYELGFDRFNLKKDRIYRLTTFIHDETSEESIATTYPNVFYPLLSRIPEIETGVRLFDRGFNGSGDVVKVNNNDFLDQKIYYADSTLFRVFSLPLAEGSERYALSGPGKAVLSVSAAKRFFGKTDVLGETILLNAGEMFKVSGVMQDIPAQSHFHCDIILSMDSHPWVRRAHWNGLVFSTYLLLRKGADPGTVENKITQYIREDNPDMASALQLPLQKLTDIHLRSHMKFELEANHDIRYIYIFITIALFLLIIAGIDYINLETSRSNTRLKEVGVRKIFGAGRKNLILQFVGESVFTSLSALVIAVIIIDFFLPVFNMLSGTHFSFTGFFNDGKWIVILLVTVLIGIITGLYPALTASLLPVETLSHGRTPGLKKGSLLRRILVVAQFSITLLLIIGTLVISNQMRFIRNKNLGIRKDHIMALQMNTSGVKKNSESIKKELLTYHSIEEICRASQIPLHITFMEDVNIENYKAGSAPFYCMETDGDFFKTTGVELLTGRYFSEPYNSNSPEYIVNESAVRLMGVSPEEAIGRNIMVRHGDMKQGPVIGVVKDFNFASLHQRVAPLVIWQYPGNFQYLLCKIEGSDIQGTVSYIERKWKELTGLPLDFTFSDQEFNNLYRQEVKAGRLFSVFSITTLLIACIGLLGLSSFMTVQRTKEVGIRKVLGSTTAGISFMFLRDNMKSIFIAVIISIPPGIILSRLWLNDFSYKISPGPGIYLLSVLIIFLISMATVSWHAIRCAHTNPVDTLRYE